MMPHAMSASFPSSRLSVIKDIYMYIKFYRIIIKINKLYNWIINILLGNVYLLNFKCIIRKSGSLSNGTHHNGI